MSAQDLANRIAAAEHTYGEEFVAVVADQNDLHHADDCDHGQCHGEGDCVESLNRDELEAAVRDNHMGWHGSAPGTHDVGNYRTCSNGLCVRLARILGHWHQWDDV